MSGERAARFRVSSGSLPPGLALDKATGELSGRPKKDGTYRFRVEAQLGSKTAVGPETALAVTGYAPGTVFVADASADEVEIVAPDGTTEAVTGTDLNDPLAVAVDSQGNIYIADYGNDRVVEEPANGGAQITLETDFDEPNAIAVDDAGNVFVSCGGSGLIDEIPAGGKQVTVYSQKGVPKGIAVDAAGDLFIAEYGQDEVLELPAGSTTTSVVVSGIDDLEQIAVNAAGDLYIAETDTDAVLEVPKGSSSAHVVSSDVGSPTAVALDAVGDIFVADPPDSAVYEIPVGGGTPSTFGIGYVTPNGVAVYDPPPTFVDDTPTLAATVGTPYSYTYVASVVSGEPAATFAVESGTLPAGLKLSSTTGVLSGTPTTVDGYTFVIEAENVAGGTLAPSATITVTLSTSGGAPTPGSVIIADSANDRVLSVPASGVGESLLAGSLSDPTGVAFDNAGDEYVAETDSNTVIKLPPGGGTATTVGSGLSGPSGVAVNNDRDVFIADTGNNRVVEVSGKTGTQSVIGSDMNGPQAVAVAVDGEVFVADTNDNQILGELAGVQSVVASDITDPTGIAVNAAGDLFVVEQSADEVIEIPAGGGPAVVVASGLDGPRAVAIDAVGDVFVADTGADSVIELPAGGGSQLSVGVGLSKPRGVAVYAPPPALTATSPPTLVTAGTAYSYQYTASAPSGEPAARFAVGSGSLPLGLSLDPTTGVLSGTPADFGVYRFKIEAENFANGLLGPATTVTVTGLEAGTVFVSDADDQVIEIPPNGGPQKSVGDGLNDPAGLALDNSGNLYIANEGDNEVIEVPTGGGAQKTIATGLDWPIGVAVDNSGDVFIANTGADDVVEVTPSGTRTTVTTSGLSDPTDVAVDDLGDVFIADFGNNRVVVEQAGGSQLNQAIDLDEPAGIALNDQDEIYYADMGDNEVWRTNGLRRPFQVGSNLNQPDSVAYDANGNLYIADYDGLVEVPSSGAQTTVGTGLYIPIGVTVYAPPPTFVADTPTSAATVGTVYSYTYTASVLAGEPAASFVLAAGALPPGIKLNSTTGALSGTPTTAGTFKFTIAAENAANAIEAPQATVTVGTGPSFRDDSPPPSARLGSAYAGYRFRASGYPAPVFTISSGALPPGIRLDSVTGSLSGFPTMSGRFSFVVRASNAASAPALTPRLAIDVSGSGDTAGPARRKVSSHLASGRAPTARSVDRHAARLRASRSAAHEHREEAVW